MKIIITLIMIVYLAVGCFVNGLVREDWESPSLVIVLLWPLAICMFLFFGLLSICADLGKKLKDFLKL